MVPAEVIDRRALLQEAVPRLLDLARREGLPFSKYDQDDLDELPEAHRRALARAMGCDESVDAMLKTGAKVYKNYRRNRKTSQVPLLLPLLLKPLARHAEESASGLAGRAARRRRCRSSLGFLPRERQGPQDRLTP